MAGRLQGAAQLRLAPHLAGARHTIPDLLNGLVDDRLRDGAGRQCAVGQAAALHREQAPNRRPIRGRMIRRCGSDDYLPIGIVKIDRRTRLALIEFPVESGQGTNRAWVRFEELQHEIEPVAV